MIVFHTTCGIIALCAGAWNLMRPKGTRRHRLVGWIYAGSMAALIGTSFFIYELFGTFGAFHVMSLVSGGGLALAIYFPLRRHAHPNWLQHHYYWITYSYVGLVMATGSHLFASLPGWPYWGRALLFWGVPYVVGTFLIANRKDDILGPFVSAQQSGAPGEKAPLRAGHRPTRGRS